MVTYKVAVTTATSRGASTLNCVYIKLVGKEGASERTQLADHYSVIDNLFTASSFSVDCPVSLGELVLIELDKQPHLMLNDAWFPSKIVVTAPEGDVYPFPIYRWITDGQTHLFREGKAVLCFEDKLPLAKQFREEELKQRKKDYRWYEYAEGIPHCMQSADPSDLPPEVQFSFTKKIGMAYTTFKSMTELKLEGLVGSKDNWKSIAEINNSHNVSKTDISDYVQKHWTEDAFFGYQNLNGLNPMLIHRCLSALPDNFPVTNDMLSLDGGRSLEEEMTNGNIFLCDYKLLQGVEPNIIDQVQQHLLAPLVLLHSTPDHKLMPVAIQLKQKPSEENPIFLPSDSEHDWLLAKIYVRGAAFSEHQLNTHFLRTHLLAEVFAMSLLRNVPMVHPLYKLLIPHTRYTLHINSLSRDRLIGKENGFFNKFAASGGDALTQILRRSTASLTYSSLCLPEDIRERGMESLPGYYYRDDGLKMWDIINRFVEGMLGYYYKTDDDIQRDSELQNWIQEIFQYGFLLHESTGAPQRFNSVSELVKFVTMVVFTCSAQHSAVNTGQYDYGGWMPNGPLTLQRPHPTTKGSSTKSTILETLPNVGNTAQGMAAMWLLSRQSFDQVPLGHYPEEHFCEETPRRLMEHFRAELDSFSDDINGRNQKLEVPYTYMDPKVVANSVNI